MGGRRLSGAKESRRRRGTAVVAGIALALLAGSCGGKGGNARLPSAPPTVNVAMREYRFDYDQSSVPRGRVVFRGRNIGHRTHAIVLVALPEGFPPINEQLHSKTRRGLATLAYLHPLRPGMSDSFAVELAPGRYAMISFVKGRDGVPDALKGMNSEFRVR